jgi:hypothetical protein
MATLMLILVFMSGCVTNPPVNTTNTSTPTPTPTPTATVSPSITPTPTPTIAPVLPSEYGLDVTIIKDRVYQTITVTFAGGKGQIWVQKMYAKVTYPDGKSVTKDILFTKQIPVGASVEIPGSRGVDHVEVYAVVNGVTYKIADELAGNYYSPIMDWEPLAGNRPPY